MTKTWIIRSKQGNTINGPGTVLVKARTFSLNDAGYLKFYDEESVMIGAIAPGDWHSCQEADPEGTGV